MQNLILNHYFDPIDEKRKWAMITKPIFLVPLSLQPNGESLRYCKF